MFCKKRKSSFATAWMDIESIMLTEVSQTEKGKYCIISLVYTILKRRRRKKRSRKAIKKYKLPVIR